MIFTNVVLATLVVFSTSGNVYAFVTPSNIHSSNTQQGIIGRKHAIPLFVRDVDTSLRMAVGLGPDLTEEVDVVEIKEEIEEPDHESFRYSRLNEFDIKCDEWYGSLLGNSEQQQCLGEVSADALDRITTLHELKRPHVPEKGDDDWSRYQINPLPGTPVLPAYGLEQYGLPTLRRSSEAWSKFDVVGLVNQDYSGTPSGTGSNLVLDEATRDSYESIFRDRGIWIEEENCLGRLVYINGRYVPSLSLTSDYTMNLNKDDFTGQSSIVTDEVIHNMKHLPDGFSDRLEADVPDGDSHLTSFKTLSGPHHNVGEPTSQFSVNGQAQSASFVALNSLRAGSVAFINIPSNMTSSTDNKRVLVINAKTSDAGYTGNGGVKKGVTFHPRSLVMLGENSEISFIQSFVDLDKENDEKSRPILCNSCTQMYVKSNSTLLHSYMEETGGMVTAGVGDVAENDGNDLASREIEAKRTALRNTHMESIDVHVIGDKGTYEGTVLNFGGNGRSRIITSNTLLRPGSHATMNGLSLTGGAQRSELRSLIHHIAQGTTCKQLQRNMVGGRGLASFRGKIRVEQSAQQTAADQLIRTILLSDKSRAWAIPSMEIIADDVTCAHGATISDLSSEELFYLRSRGLDLQQSRNILMFAFVAEVVKGIDPYFIGEKDNVSNLRNRVVRSLQNLVPKGERKIQGDFQSV